MNTLLIVCGLQTVAIIFLAYLHFKTVADMSSKLMAKNLYEVKEYQAKPEKKNPNDDIPEDDEVAALRYEVENKKRLELLKKDNKELVDGMLQETWG